MPPQESPVALRVVHRFADEIIEIEETRSIAMQPACRVQRPQVMIEPKRRIARRQCDRRAGFVFEQAKQHLRCLVSEFGGPIDP